MTIPQKSFTQIVNDIVTAWSNNIGIVPTLAAGDALLAIFQAVSAQIDFLQGQVLAVNDLSRAQTSAGADLDSWMAQFNFFRNLAVMAEGEVTFASLIPAVNQALIPAGSLVQTTGGAVQYQVIADTTQPTWSPVYNAYVLLPGQSSLTASVQAILAGSSSNVIALQLNQIGSQLTGIDTVTNPAPIDNGIDQETDAAFLARFPLYLASLAEATQTAILSAANSVQQGLQIALLENLTPGGVTQVGAFTVLVDNGTGAPPSGLLSLIYAAVNAARAFTVQAFVSGPTVIVGNILIILRIAPNYSQSQVSAAVQNALATYINNTGIGSTLFVSALETAALAVPGVLAIEAGTTTINGVNADLLLQPINVVRSTVGNISIGTY